MSRFQESYGSSHLSPLNFMLLDACDSETYSDDNGALLGQISMLRAGMFVERRDDLAWHEAVSCAVSAH